jgi:hypothetical protein
MAFPFVRLSAGSAPAKAAGEAAEYGDRTPVGACGATGFVAHATLRHDCGIAGELRIDFSIVQSPSVGWPGAEGVRHRVFQIPDSQNR